MIVMDFTTTAMSRPKLIDKTYDSFTNKLKGIDLKECRLFINVEPLPDVSAREEVIEVSKKYFKEVHYNFPEKSNFTAACNWVWSHAETDYIFHLEDDWILTEDVDVGKLLKQFKHNPELLEVALRAYRYSYTACPLSPCIMHKRFYKAVAGKLDEGLNPESQLRGKSFGIYMPDSVKATKGKLFIHPPDINRIIIKDIGRAWMKSSAFSKPNGAKAHFTTWVSNKSKK